MNIVKEHINEKFTDEDSDSIYDLGIGMKHEIIKFIKSKRYIAHDADFLWLSSLHGKVHFVKYLLDNGANVHYWGDAALRHASNNGHTEIVKILLDAGADVHANDDSALIYACKNGHVEVVKILLDAGADVHAKNDLALNWATNKGHSNVVKILQDHITEEKNSKNIKESLFEKFTDEDSDPIKDLGIGIIREIKKWLEKYYITKYHINDDLSIDVNQTIVLEIASIKHIEKLPDYIKFNKVNGDFIGTPAMTSMKGFPKYIKGDLVFKYNKLKSLKYMPSYIGGNCNLSNFSKKEIRKVCNVKGILENYRNDE